MTVNSIPFFFIGLSPAPPTDVKTPEGRDGWDELASDGISLVRTGVGAEDWTGTMTQQTVRCMDTAFAHGIYSTPNLRELSAVRNDADRERLVQFIRQFKNHPGLLMYKSHDEPQWGKIPAGPLETGYRVARAEDPAHPVWTMHAPRGTLDELKPYNAVCDILGTDIYPVSEPPGKHSLLPNKGLSMVGDYTKKMTELANGQKMVFMVLQGCWSGVVHDPPRRYNRLMFPTFREQRYMVYQAIICGARSVAFFGVGQPLSLYGRDKECGWNWTWWRGVMRPLLAEIKEGSELYPILIAPNSSYPLKHTGAPQVDVLWREAGIYLYVLAAAREGKPSTVRFSGLQDGEVTVLFENRTLQTSNGSFEDRFQPHDVHVYRALRVIPWEKPPKRDAKPSYWTPQEAKPGAR